MLHQLSNVNGQLAAVRVASSSKANLRRRIELHSLNNLLLSITTLFCHNTSQRSRERSIWTATPKRISSPACDTRRLGDTQEPWNHAQRPHNDLSSADRPKQIQVQHRTYLQHDLLARCKMAKMTPATAHKAEAAYRAREGLRMGVGVAVELVVEGVGI